MLNKKLRRIRIPLKAKAVFPLKDLGRYSTEYWLSIKISKI
jgi:hypothetical protein